MYRKEIETRQTQVDGTTMQRRRRGKINRVQEVRFIITMLTRLLRGIFELDVALIKDANRKILTDDASMIQKR